MNLLVALFLIIFEAVSEGLYDRQKKTIAGVIEFIYRAVVTLIIFAWLTNYWHINTTAADYWVTVVGYVILRFAIFDVIYSLARGNTGIFYIGNTKLYERALVWLIDKGKVSYSLIIFVKFIALVWGISWLMGWQHGIVC